jgi:hypothetical protein
MYIMFEILYAWNMEKHMYLVDTWNVDDTFCLLYQTICLYILSVMLA